MKCVACQRYIKTPSALTDGGLPMGPVCARKNGLTKPRKQSDRVLFFGRAVRAAKALPGQLPLIEVVV